MRQLMKTDPSNALKQVNQVIVEEKLVHKFNITPN